MAKLTLRQTGNLIARYFYQEGWFPPGTALKDWKTVTLAGMGIDDPPLPGDPHLQKKMIALDLQKLFFLLGSELAHPLPALKKATHTLETFADWCFNNQI